MLSYKSSPAGVVSFNLKEPFECIEQLFSGQNSSRWFVSLATQVQNLCPIIGIYLEPLMYRCDRTIPLFGPRGLGESREAILVLTSRGLKISEEGSLVKESNSLLKSTLDIIRNRTQILAQERKKLVSHEIDTLFMYSLMLTHLRWRQRPTTSVFITTAFLNFANDFLQWLSNKISSTHLRTNIYIDRSTHNKKRIQTSKIKISLVTGMQ